jgi:hypothetical protein
VALFAVSIVTLHVGAEPEQAPLHPTKLEPDEAAAVRTVAAPFATFSVQSPGHAIPVPVTIPLPTPATVTVSGYVVKIGMLSNLAVTVRVPVNGTILHDSASIAVPEQAPPQPANRLPGAGDAKRWTQHMPLMKAPM